MFFMESNSLKLNNLSERLVYILDITGTRKADLARAINVKPQVIHFLCKSKTKSSRFTFEIATILGVNTRWLATGEGVIFVADDPKRQMLEAYQRIPLLDFENIIKAHKSKSLDSVTTTNWLMQKTKAKNVFAIKISDDSMEPIIPTNATAFIQLKENYSAQNGDILLVFLKQFNALIVREFSIEQNKNALLPKNLKNYQKTFFSQDVQIVGLVTDYYYSFRR